MEWDLGLGGFALLVGMSLAFGLVAHLVAARGSTLWMGVIAAATFLVGGLLISEWWFGDATEEELQPNIDGLSFDETLLAVIPGIVAVLLTRYLTTRSARRHGVRAQPRLGH